jgi:hypothetical protein
MAKWKKAPGRLIGRWKQEAIAGNTGASDEDLAKIINDMARREGYAYTITPEKVRSKSKKRKRRRHAARPAQADAPTAATAAPAPKPAAKSAGAAGLSLEDVRALKGLVERVGAEAVRELAVVLA